MYLLFVVEAVIVVRVEVGDDTTTFALSQVCHRVFPTDVFFNLVNLLSGGSNTNLLLTTGNDRPHLLSHAYLRID